MSLTASQIIADQDIRVAVQDAISKGAKWGDIMVALRMSLSRAEYAVREETRANARHEASAGSPAPKA